MKTIKHDGAVWGKANGTFEALELIARYCNGLNYIMSSAFFGPTTYVQYADKLKCNAKGTALYNHTFEIA